MDYTFPVGTQFQIYSATGGTLASSNPAALTVTQVPSGGVRATKYTVTAVAQGDGVLSGLLSGNFTVGPFSQVG